MVNRPLYVVKGGEPGSAAWRGYVTASRVPAIMGYIKDWGKDARTEMDFILGKSEREELDPDQEESMYWGTRFEREILLGWQELHNRRYPFDHVSVRHRPSSAGMLVSKERPWFGVTP